MVPPRDSSSQPRTKQDMNVRQYTALMYSFPSLEPVHSSMSGSNCCLLTCIQISQEAGEVVCYTTLEATVFLKN